TGNATAGMFLGEKLVIGYGSTIETGTLTAAPARTQITATFANAHAQNDPVLALGAFGTGIVPPLASPSTYAPNGTTFTYANGSTDPVWKMYGDITANGSMVYIEYTCDGATSHNLYRNMMAWDATSKPAVSASQI